MVVQVLHARTWLLSGEVKAAASAADVGDGGAAAHTSHLWHSVGVRAVEEEDFCPLNHVHREAVVEEVRPTHTMPAAGEVQRSHSFGRRADVAGRRVLRKETDALEGAALSRHMERSEPVIAHCSHVGASLKQQAEDRERASMIIIRLYSLHKSRLAGLRGSDQ